jgi:hypothetical protein
MTGDGELGACSDRFSLMVRSVASRRVSNHASFETPTRGRLLRMRIILPRVAGEDGIA